MEDLIKQLEAIVASDLAAIEGMDIASDKRKISIDDVSILIGHLEKLEESRIKEKGINFDTVYKYMQLNADNDMRKKEIAQKKVRETAQSKNESKRNWLDFTAKVLGFAAGAGCTVVAIVADHNGWFPSRLGLSVTKPKLF